MKTSIALLTTAGLAGCALMQGSPVLPDARSFSCGPRVVSAGDTVVLTKRSPALRELAVLRPGAQAPHFLVVGQPPGGMEPLMPAERLAVAREVRIEVGELTGLEWRVGAMQERVFTVPGTYRFLIGPTLESDLGAYSCEVEYRPDGQRTDRSS